MYGGRTPEERRAERRQRFREAGLELFAERGYASTTIEALCTEAGLAARYFYEEFGQREVLLREVYDEVVAHAARVFEEALAAAPLELEAQVRAGVAAVTHAMVDDERRARIAYAEVQGASPALEQHRMEIVRAFADRQAQQLEGLARAGLIAERDFATAAMAIAGATNQVLQDWLSRPRRERIDAVVDELTALFVAALGGPATTIC